MGVLPEVMPAAVYRRPGEVVVEERPVPRPGPGEVLVEVDHCGICGSDIHMLLDGWGDKPGLVAGHEFTGTIAALGAGVEGWEIGRDGGRAARPPSAVGAAVASRGSPPSARTARARSSTATTGPSPATCWCGPPSLLRLPAGPHRPPGGAGRAAGRGPPRDHPLGGRPPATA